MTELDASELARLRHDLGGPLSVIMGYGSLLAVRSDERLRLEAAKQISAAAEVLTQRIDDLFDQLSTNSDPTTPKSSAEHADKCARILVIDDDLHLRKLLQATFDGSNFQVVTASDTTDVMPLLEPPPALVILDWHLPSGSGADVLAQIKRNDAAVPVVVLTGDARADATALGADAYLTKPFSPLQLLETVEQLTTCTHSPAPHPD